VIRPALALALPLLFLAAPLPAQPARDDDRETIVVTGTPIRDTERALKDCLRRNCPPEEDINATLAHAENLFVAGDYVEARKTTLASIRRNGGHAKAFPVPVSDLYRANGRIAAHLGEGEDYMRSINNVKRALRAGLPAGDIRIVGANLEKAGMFASLGRFERARQLYDEVAEDSAELGRPDLAGVARVRKAWLHEIAGDRWAARRELRKIAEDRTPGVQVPRVTALILLDRLDRKEGKPGSTDALIREVRALGASAPVLLFSPPIDLHTGGRMDEADPVGSTTRLAQMDDVEDVWIDVGFWVTPEGRVDEVEIIRSSGFTRWARPVLKSIAGRLYSPSPEGAGQYRVERYSYTALWKSDSTGTRFRVRSPAARIEFLDLTAEPETP
jgi:tetratricopeptide (TPR) repeat protein